MNPLVSIIVPNYNHEAFLQKRLESVYAQTYGEIEVILLDDQSTDASRFYLEKFKHHRLTAHYVVNTKNSGSPFKQWQKGLALANGKYVWIAESDDWAENDFLEKLVPFLEQDDAISLAYCQSRKINAKGKIVDDMLRYTQHFSPNKWERNFVGLGDTEIKEHLVYKNTIPNASAVVFRNSPTISKALNTSMTMAGDWWFWVNIIKGKKIAFLADHLNYHRSHANSTRTNLDITKKKANILEQKAVLALIAALFPTVAPTIKAEEERLVFDLIQWVSPIDFKDIQQFIQENFAPAKRFSSLVLQAYTSWVFNKSKNVKKKLSSKFSPATKPATVQIPSLSPAKYISKSVKYQEVEKSAIVAE